MRICRASSVGRTGPSRTTCDSSEYCVFLSPTSDHESVVMPRHHAVVFDMPAARG